MPGEIVFSEKLEGILPYLKNVRGKKIGIKVHFGEKGNKTFIQPDIISKIYKEVKKNNPKAEINLIDCNVLYKSERSETSSHIQIAREHGFKEPIEILDGDEEIHLGLKHFDKAYVGKGLGKYDCLLAISHVKGHIMTGFAGAIKNLGMGLASRKGKLALHSSSCPIVSKKCVKCGKCIEECPAKAISMQEKAFIDKHKCIGCAHCINVCPEEAIDAPWGSVSSEILQEKIVEYAYGINKKIKCYYLNALVNITKDCDCMGVEMEKQTGDIGFLFSENLLEIDKKSYKLVEEKSPGLFKKMNPKTNPGHQIEYIKKMEGNKNKI